MTFLNPGLLWGLLAVSIPIIIHLFNFRRVKKVNFSNVSLLKTVNTQAKTFLKLKQWIVLASRILFITSLVMAFAQPFLPSKNGNISDGRAINSFYIDNSASMQSEIDNKSALSLALKKIDRLAGELPKSTKNQILSNDFTSTDYKIFNSAELKNEASKIEISGTSRTIEEVFDRQKSILEKNGTSLVNTYFMFSDFQKSTSGDLKKLLNDKTNKIYLVPNEVAENSNVYVDSVWLDNPFIRKMQANGINVRLANNGKKNVSNLPVKLVLGDLQMNSIPINIEGNSKTTIHFDFNINQSGIIKGKIKFEDNPITFDNEHFIVLNASPIIRVIQLNNSSYQNNSLKNAFSNDSLFNYSSFPINNVDFGLLKNADLLILEGIEYFNSNASETIKKFLNEGGSVFVIPAVNPDLGNYSSLFNQFGIKNLEKNATENRVLKPLAEPIKESDFYKDIFEATSVKDRLTMPNTSELVRWQTFGDAILKTKGSQNFLTSTKTKNGALYMLASPLDEAFGNFNQNALFVPILYKMAAMSIKSGPLSYRFDRSSISLQDKSYSEKTLVKLRKDGVEMIPLQRVVGNELIIELPSANEMEGKNSLLAGYYDVLVNNSLSKVIALNFNNRESLLEKYSATELSRMFENNKNIQILNQADAAEFSSNYSAISQGKYIWKFFVIAALLFLAIEILIIRFWR
jgi:hypothetical protein